MTTAADSLALRRRHLADNRRMLIARSVASAVAGVVPVPILDDWLSSRVRRGTVRRIASRHGVDIDERAVVAIADGPSSPPSWAQIAGSTLVFKLLARGWRKSIIAYVATERASNAAHAYTVATLFDHYCATLHVGWGLDGASGMALRQLIDASARATDGGLGTIIFRRALVAAAKATMRAPAELLDLATRGRIRKMLRYSDEVDAVAEVDIAIERSMDEETGFLGRAARVVEAQLSSEGNPYLDELLTRFEADWRARNRPDLKH